MTTEESLIAIARALNPELPQTLEGFMVSIHFKPGTGAVKVGCVYLDKATPPPSEGEVIRVDIPAEGEHIEEA